MSAKPVQHCLRIYNDTAGETHFGDIEIELAEASYAPPAPPFWVAPGAKAQSCIFTRLSVGWSSAWHPTPTRQYFIQTGGELEVSVSDGARRRLLPGQVVLVEDTHGKGHTTRVVGNADVTGLFVHLA